MALINMILLGVMGTLGAISHYFHKTILKMNMSFVNLCLGGGAFAVLGFLYFFVDFVCQTHFEAMKT